jgi:hypothetical protein
MEAKTAAGRPAEHVLGVVGFQEAVAAEVAEHPTSHGVLKVLQKLVGEGGGFVKAEAGSRAGGIVLVICVWFDPVEETIDHAHVVVKMGVQRRAETMEEAGGPEGGGSRSRGTGLPEGGLEGPEQDVKDGAGGPGPVVEVGPQTLGNGEDELAHRHVGNDVVHQVSRRLGHALGPARRTGASGLARERHEELMATTRAPSPGEPMSQDAAPQIAPELLLHVIRHPVAHGVGLVGQGEVALEVLPDDAVQRGGLGAAPTIGLGAGVDRWSGSWCGPPGFPASRVGLNRHKRPPASREASRSVTTSRTAEGWGGRMGNGDGGS